MNYSVQNHLASSHQYFDGDVASSLRCVVFGVVGVVGVVHLESHEGLVVHIAEIN